MTLAQNESWPKIIGMVGRLSGPGEAEGTVRTQRAQPCAPIQIRRCRGQQHVKARRRTPQVPRVGAEYKVVCAEAIGFFLLIRTHGEGEYFSAHGPRKL